MTTPLPEVLTIPVRTAVAKYLRRHLHLAPGDAFRLTKKCTVGRLLYHLLRNPQTDRQYSDTTATHTERFQVHISQQMSWLNGCRFLTPLAVHDFNRQVEEEINKEFIGITKALADYGVQFETKKAALNFMALYDFTEEDITLDALIKAYYRYRKAQEIAHARAVLIPKCPAPALAG